MKQFLSNVKIGLCILCLLLSFDLFAQVTISGTIFDEESNEPLIGANITLKGKVIGTTTDSKGNFSLTTNTAPPFTILISSVGYLTQELEVTGSTSGISIKLPVQSVVGQEVVVSASRVEESILESPVAIEKMDIVKIRNIATSTFYESLGNMKGIELATQSATFQSLNSRGFAATGNTRVLQLIDGMDSQSITNNFSYGNLVGINELDVQSVEILPGASAVLYGPGAINGTILINSKNPFQYQGFSVLTQVGLMHVNSPDRENAAPYYNFGLRYAKSFNDRFAFKINAGFVKAIDWHASDASDAINAGAGVYNEGGTRQNNPGYNGVNFYGDEGFNVVNFGDPAFRNGIRGALQAAPFNLPMAVASNLANSLPVVNVSRTGYREADLANYNAYSLKLHTAFHYRISDAVEAIAQINVNNGRTVYTGSGRFNVSNFMSGQGKLEFRGSNFFVRGYVNWEDAGDSYDIQTLGQRIENGWKSNTQWWGEYAFAYLGLVPGVAPANHTAARTFADLNRPAPGSDQFNQLKKQFEETPLNQFGTRFTARNYFMHFEGSYNFDKVIDPKTLEIIVGAHYRRFVPNTEGTIFDDASEFDPVNPNVAVRDISVWEIGAYLQLTKRFFEDRLKIVVSARGDKNQNFEARFTPRIAAVLSMGANKQHNLRVAYQTGFRNPSMLNQWQNLTVGGVVTLIGGLPEFYERFFNAGVVTGVGSPGYATIAEIQQRGAFLAGAPGVTNPEPFQFRKFRPEFVQSAELGFKSLINNNFFIDLFGYFNWYENFIGGQILFQLDPSSPIGVKQYSVPYTIEEGLKSFGWGLSFDYKLPKGYNLAGNVSSDVLETSGSTVFPGNFQPAFNSPRYRSNLNFNNRNVYKNLGFNIAWRWQDRVNWENGGFFTGNIPGYHIFDAAITYKITGLKSILKIGGSNIFNNYYRQAFANPNIGGLYYISIMFDQVLN